MRGEFRINNKLDGRFLLTTFRALGEIWHCAPKYALFHILISLTISMFGFICSTQVELNYGAIIY